MAFIATGITASTAAAISAATAVAGLGLGVAQMTQAKKAQNQAQRDLENRAKNSPLYKGSKSVDDYYQEALNRYRENPYQSQQYQIGQQNIQRATAQGLSALQDRRSAIGGISRLAGSQMDAMRNLGAQAEMTKQQRLAQLGAATQAKSGQEYKEFDINKMTPYERQLQLGQMKAAAEGERYSAGLQTVGSSLSNLASLGIADVYANPRTPKTNTELPKFNNKIPGSPYGNWGKTNFTQYFPKKGV